LRRAMSPLVPVLPLLDPLLLFSASYPFERMTFLAKAIRSNKVDSASSFFCLQSPHHHLCRSIDLVARRASAFWFGVRAWKFSNFHDDRRRKDRRSDRGGTIPKRSLDHARHTTSPACYHVGNFRRSPRSRGIGRLHSMLVVVVVVVVVSRLQTSICIVRFCIVG
jgi:hypothetical protein